jgi:hypothetical protein
MKLLPLFFGLLLLTGCSDQGPFKVGDTLVAASDGTELGRIIEIGNHSFENGASGRSVHVQLPSGKDAWYSLDTTKVSYLVKP